MSNIHYICPIKLINKTVIPMEEVKKMNIRTIIRTMQIGDVRVFPIKKFRIVRVYASELGLDTELKYQTRTNRDARTITVTRLK